MPNSILSKSVLILNTNYSPMDICSAKRAICLFYNQKVEILESYREKVHSPSISLLLPSIIKLKSKKILDKVNRIKRYGKKNSY